jgi:hypothetical protein
MAAFIALIEAGFPGLRNEPLNSLTLMSFFLAIVLF